MFVTCLVRLMLECKARGKERRQGRPCVCLLTLPALRGCIGPGVVALTCDSDRGNPRGRGRHRGVTTVAPDGAHLQSDRGTNRRSRAAEILSEGCLNKMDVRRDLLWECTKQQLDVLWACYAELRKAVSFPPLTCVLSGGGGGG
jgi:hypothetical protein